MDNLLEVVRAMRGGTAPGGWWGYRRSQAGGEDDNRRVDARHGAGVEEGDACRGGVATPRCRGGGVEEQQGEPLGQGERRGGQAMMGGVLVDSRRKSCHARVSGDGEPGRTGHETGALHVGGGGDRTVGRRSVRGGNVRGGQVIMFASLLLLLLGQADGQTFNPVFRWMGQTLFECEKASASNPTVCGQQATAPVIAVGPGERRACTATPQTSYPCSATDLAGCSCNGVCDQSECMTVVSSLEDTWSNLGMKIMHKPGPNAPEIEYAKEPADLLTVVLEVLFGTMDVFGTLPACGDAPVRGSGSAWVVPTGSKWINVGVVPYVWRCNVLVADIPNPPNGKRCSVQEDVAKCVPSSITYDRIELSDVLTKRKLTLSGNYPQINEAVINLQYKADSNFNTGRLRSSLYSGVVSCILKHNVSECTRFTAPPALRCLVFTRAWT